MSDYLPMDGLPAGLVQVSVQTEIRSDAGYDREDVVTGMTLVFLIDGKEHTLVLREADESQLVESTPELELLALFTGGSGIAEGVADDPRIPDLLDNVKQRLTPYWLDESSLLDLALAVLHHVGGEYAVGQEDTDSTATGVDEPDEASARAVRRFLEVSTGNMTEKDSQKLAALPSTHDMGYGWFVYVDRDCFAERAAACREHGMSAAFIAVLSLAKKHGADYVLFDRDADPCPGLPTFEW